MPLDALALVDHGDLKELLQLVVTGFQDDVFAISALSGDGVEQVLDAIATALNAAAQSDEIVLDHAYGKRRAWLYAQGVVIEERARDTESVLSLSWTSKQKTQFAAL